MAKSSIDPHYDQPILTSGEPLESARLAMLMIHGRGASAEDILSISGQLSRPDFAYLAPQAADNAWYPLPFTASFSENEPWLSSALDRIDHTLDQIHQAGIPVEKTILLGFSQGACLTLEYCARNPQRYGGIVGLSGSLIGLDHENHDARGSFEETPVFLGCSDADSYVEKEYVMRTAEVFRRMGASVTERFYTQMGHTVNQDELDFVKGMMKILMD
jgi:predicted esterase